jgi:hypothetical protein
VYTRDLIRQLRDNNINIGKVYSIIAAFFGNEGNVPFTKRSLRNLCGQLSREHADDDVWKAVDQFDELGAKDPEFMFCVQAGGEGKIKNLMWTTGASRMQYKFFGDAITFALRTRQPCMTCLLGCLWGSTITSKALSWLV